jgi:hypothetical protein
VSVEGGMTGTQRRFVCEKCGKVFFAWRPDTAPGVKVKCYFCKHEMEDEATKRERPAPPAAPAPAPTVASAPASSAAPAPAPEAPAADENPAPDTPTQTN